MSEIRTKNNVYFCLNYQFSVEAVVEALEVVGDLVGVRTDIEIKAIHLWQ